LLEIDIHGVLLIRTVFAAAAPRLAALDDSIMCPMPAASGANRRRVSTIEDGPDFILIYRIVELVFTSYNIVE
jgi:hypothetical protein